MQNQYELSNNHRRVLYMRLHLIERYIDDLDFLLTNHSKKTTYHVIRDLDQNKVAECRLVLEEIRSRIAGIVEKYQLTIDRRPTSRILEAKKVNIWEILSDTFAEKLTGYGAFPAEQAPAYNAKIAELLKLVEQL